MGNQAESWARPPGWYDVGSGWMAYWDGGGWTGHRMQRPPVPPAPAPPAAQRQGMPRWLGTPWFVWVGLAVIAFIFGLPLLAAFMQGFSTGFSGR